MFAQITSVCVADDACEPWCRGGTGADVARYRVLQLGESVNKTISMALFYAYKNPKQYPDALVG